MKNFTQKRLPTLLFTVLILGLVRAQAQETATVTLNVVLNSAAALTINDGFDQATLTYAAANDYANGVELDQTKALTAVSSQPYSISVFAASALTNGDEEIPVADVTVTPTAEIAGDVTLTAQAIPVGSSSAATIISSSTGTTTQDFDLNYSTKNADQQDFLNKPEGTYTTTLTYTLTNP